MGFLWFGRSKVEQPTLQLLSNMQIIASRAKDLRKQEKDTKKLFKRIRKSYTVQKVEKYQKSYLPKKPDKFKEKMEKLVSEFVKDIISFIDHYQVIFKELDDIVVLDQKQEFTDLTRIADMFTAINRSSRMLIFPPKAVEQYHEEYNAFVKEILKFIDKDWKNESRLESGKNPKVGFFKMHFSSDKKLAKQILKIDKKFVKGYGKLKKTEDRILAQTSQGIEQDFLSLFTHYVHEEGRLEGMVQLIRDDLKELIFKHIKEHNEVTNAILPFIKLIAQYKQAQDPTLHQKINDFYQNTGKKAEEYVKIENADTKSIYNLILLDRKLSSDFELKLQEGQKELFKGPGKQAI